jgi:hypothetical protein
MALAMGFPPAFCWAHMAQANIPRPSHCPMGIGRSAATGSHEASGLTVASTGDVTSLGVPASVGVTTSVGAIVSVGVTASVGAMVSVGATASPPSATTGGALHAQSAESAAIARARTRETTE